MQFIKTLHKVVANLGGKTEKVFADLSELSGNYLLIIVL